MKFHAYFEHLHGKKVAVLGIGVSNIPLIKLLRRYGAEVSAHDRRSRDALGSAAQELDSLGVTLVLGADYLKNLKAHVIFRTPGMRPDLPEIEQAVKHGAKLTSEMEAFFALCPCHIIAVTGSDGKTTTATIIAKLLEKAGKNVFLGGNIGRPLLSDVPNMQPEDYAVLELSSFQLMTMQESPEIAVVTNVTPNHLDMHLDMEEYINAKKHIFLHQSFDDTLILNYDNPITRGFADEARGCCVFFSKTERPAAIDGGVHLKDGVICFNEEVILPVEDIRLPGEHNVENYMAAIAAVHPLVPRELIVEFAREFKGVEHRIELVRVKDGVSFYNDSIASSPARTMAGLHSFDKKLILIAGGYDKKIPFDELGEEIARNVKRLILTGQTAEDIYQAVTKAPNYDPDDMEILRFETFDEAVLQAAKSAQEGDVVMLSPACASFDQFKNFAERGERFKQIVYQL